MYMLLNDAVLHYPVADIPFTVDNTVNQIEVTIEIGADPVIPFLVYDPINPANVHFFRWGDNAVFKNMYLDFPYCFKLGEGLKNASIQIEQLGFSEIRFLDFDTMPLWNEKPIPMDGFLSTNDLSDDGENWRPVLANLNLPISMIGVPDSLNGLELNAKIILEIQSNYEVRVP